MDERIKKQSVLKGLVVKPEFGSVSGFVLVMLIFGLTAYDSGMFSADGTMSWVRVSAQLIVLSVGACLLMIAGEFDLSLGSMIGFASMTLAILLSTYQITPWMAIILTFLICMAIGALNGFIVVKTGLPSFIVTLAFLFILRGLVISGSRLTTGKTQIGSLHELIENDWLSPFFGSKIGYGFFNWLAEKGIIEQYNDGSPSVDGIPMIIIWALVLVIVCSFVLSKTQFGNWIFAAGGDAKAARSVGVPVAKVKILLFVFTAFCATLYAVCQVLDFGSADAQRGLLKEFEAIIAAVIGGCLLTGGYGSIFGAMLGAIIFGVVQQGIFYTGIDSDWFRVFLGLMLLLAVLFNNFIRKKVIGNK